MKTIKTITPLAFGALICAFGANVAFADSTPSLDSTNSATRGGAECK